MPVSIPEDELQYWYLTSFKDEDGRLLFDMAHVSDMDWRQPDFVCLTLHEAFQKMKHAEGQKTKGE